METISCRMMQEGDMTMAAMPWPFSSAPTHHPKADRALWILHLGLAFPSPSYISIP